MADWNRTVSRGKSDFGLILILLFVAAVAIVAVIELLDGVAMFAPH